MKTNIYNSCIKNSLPNHFYSLKGNNWTFHFQHIKWNSCFIHCFYQYWLISFVHRLCSEYKVRTLLSCIIYILLKNFPKNVACTTSLWFCHYSLFCNSILIYINPLSKHTLHIFQYSRPVTNNFSKIYWNRSSPFCFHYNLHDPPSIEKNK